MAWLRKSYSRHSFEASEQYAWGDQAPAWVGSKLLRTYWYDGAFAPSHPKAAAQRRYFEVIARAPGVQLRLGHVAVWKPRFKAPIRRAVASAAREMGVDPAELLDRFDDHWDSDQFVSRRAWTPSSLWTLSASQVAASSTPPYWYRETVTSLRRSERRRTSVSRFWWQHPDSVVSPERSPSSPTASSKWPRRIFSGSCHRGGSLSQANDLQGYQTVAAARRGVPFVIVNLGPTDGDGIADLKLEAGAGPTMTRLVRLLE